MTPPNVCMHNANFHILFFNEARLFFAKLKFSYVVSKRLRQNDARSRGLTNNCILKKMSEMDFQSYLRN